MKLKVFLLMIIFCMPVMAAEPQKLLCLNCGQPINVQATTTINTYYNYSFISFPAANVTAGQFGQHFGNGSYTFTDILNLKGNANLSPMCTKGMVLSNNGTGLFQCVNVSDAVDVSGLDARESGNNNTQNLKMNANNNTLTELILLVNTTLNNSIFFNNLTIGSRIGLLETLHGNDNDTISNRILAIETQQESDNTTLGNRIGLLEVLHGNDNDTISTRIGSLEVLHGNDNDTISNALILLRLDNTTQANLINILYTRQGSDNVTTALRIDALEALHANDNLTIGTRIGALEVLHGLDNVTIGNAITLLRLDNTTQANLIAALTIQQESDNTTLGNRIGLLEVLHGNDNDTISNALILLRLDNTTQANLIAALTTTQGSDNNTLTELILLVNTTLNNSIFFNNLTIGSRIGLLETLHGLDNITLSNRIGVLETLHGNDNNTIGDALALLRVDNGTQESLMVSRDSLKSNLSITSIQCGGTDKFINVTVKNGVLSGSCAADQVGGGGSATTGKVPWLTNDSTFMYYNETHLNFTTGRFANASRQEADNGTTDTRIGALEVLHGLDNNTLGESLDKKFNNTGGVITGDVNVTERFFNNNSFYCYGVTCSRIYRNATGLVIEF